MDLVPFTHLHVHTQYSILDGLSDIEKLMTRTLELGMNSIAITDHGNMFGVFEFLEKANKKGIKPILGCEVYVVKNRFEKDKDEKAGDHLILLAKNLEGYHNLTKIVSYSWTEGFYYKPRIDKELLRKYNKGIICSTACLGGELPQAIMLNKQDDIKRIITEFKEIFGEDYYLELCLHKSPDPSKNGEVYENQLKVNAELLKLGAEHGIKCIATNDVHFINKDDAPVHDRFICISTASDYDDPKRMRYTSQEYLKSYDEMMELFSDNPEVVTNTVEIVDKIEKYSLNREILMPDFPLPADFEYDPIKLHNTFIKKLENDKIDENIVTELKNCENINNFIEQHPVLSDSYTIAKQFQYLTYLTYLGASKRYKENIPEERINYELSVVERMGFPGYFLIVWDFIKKAKEIGVAVGPGRGSAAGSVVAYCLFITDIEPIKYGLLFERFFFFF
jgi:DNA polymerase-3 subunit alpha